MKSQLYLIILLDKGIYQPEEGGLEEIKSSKLLDKKSQIVSRKLRKDIFLQMLNFTYLYLSYSNF